MELWNYGICRVETKKDEEITRKARAHLVYYLVGCVID